MMRIFLIHGSAKRVNSRVTGNPDHLGAFSLIEEIKSALFGWSEIILTYNINCLTIKLLWPRAADIMST